MFLRGREKIGSPGNSGESCLEEMFVAEHESLNRIDKLNVTSFNPVRTLYDLNTDAVCVCVYTL